MSKLLVLIFMMGASCLYAQVTLQPVVPSVGLIQKAQLWNVIAINSSTQQQSCRMQLVLKDRATNSEVLTATSGQFQLAPGTTQLNATALNPIQYNNLMQSTNNSMLDLLPVGNYLACYELSSVKGDGINLAEECVQFDVEALSPPMLMFPADSSLLDAIPAQFSWTPPTPEGMFTRLRYDVLITGINEGQLPAEAIEENMPFYSEGNHLNNTLSYAASLPAFEKDKWYVWQVTARDDRSYAGKSESWVFKINANNTHTVSSSASFLTLNTSDKVQGIRYISNGILNVSYHSFDREHVGTINFYTSGGKFIKKIKKKLIYGDNLLSLKLNGAFEKSVVYAIEIKSEEGRIYKGLFSISE